MLQIGTADEAVVDEEELFTPRFAGTVGFADESRQPGHRGLFLDRHQLLIVVVAEQVDDALPKVGLIEVKQLHTIVLQTEEHLRMCQATRSNSSTI